MLTPQPTWKLYGAPEAIYTICQQLADGRYLPPAAEACARALLSLAGASGWGGEYCPSCYVAVQDGNDWYEGDPDLFVDEDSGVTVAWTYGSGAGGQSSCGDCGSRGYVRNPVGEIRSMTHPIMWAKNGFTPDELGSFL